MTREPAMWSRCRGFLLFVLTVVASAARADACSCIEPGPPCETVWGADAVFVGRVISTEPAFTTGMVPPKRWIIFDVVEPFRGVQRGRTRVRTATNESSCGYPFEAGRSYLLYARRARDGALTTSICHRTGPLEERAEDLAYARSVARLDPDARGRIRGVVSLDLGQGANAPGDVTLVGPIRVAATSEGRTYHAEVDGRGEFVVSGLPRGDYEVTLETGAGFEGIAQHIAVNDPRGCGSVKLSVVYDGRLRGRLVDHRAEPLAGLPVAVSADATRPAERVETWSAEDGTFEVRRLPPGSYFVRFDGAVDRGGPRAVRHLYSPGTMVRERARPVTVHAGEHVQLGDIRVPKHIKLVTVRGQVVEANGRPVAGARIEAHHPDSESYGAAAVATSDSDGRFELRVVRGERYGANAVGYTGDTARPSDVLTGFVRFEASEGLRLTVVVASEPPLE